jgi:hypothetical protein
MKIHTIGTFEYDEKTIVGVILTGTMAEVKAVARLYSAGGDDFQVERKPDTKTTEETKP